MTSATDPKFTEFLEKYERFFDTPFEIRAASSLTSTNMDKEAEGLLDDLSFLLSGEPKSQIETRQKLRRFMGEIAHQRLKKDSK